jgi:1-acyl-sn-glycerol-3-phosphate acyltransferase
MLRTIGVYVVVAFFILMLGPLLLLWSLISGSTDVLYSIGIFGAKTALFMAGVRISVTGRENIPAGKAVVFMPNHQSNCDPPAVAAVLPPVLIMAKKEFFRVPVLGTGMRMRGFIPVDRTNRERAFGAVDKAVEALKGGYSFLAFPEGTRSKTGRLQAFKKGVFVMAIKAGAPIVPISISGTRQIMRKGDFRIHPGPVRITIHGAVATAGCGITDRARIAGQVRQAIMTGLSAEEQPIEPGAS